MPVDLITVDLLIVTPDQLRKINLLLTKKTQGNNVNWTLEFGLQERAKTTDPFVQLVKLKVDISKSNNRKAEATANKGLDDAQTSATFVAGDAVKAFNEGNLSQTAAELASKRVISSRVAA